MHACRMFQNAWRMFQSACRFMSLHAITWYCMQLHDLACSSLSLHAVPWSFMNFNELTCSSFLCLSSSQEFCSACYFNPSLSIFTKWHCSFQSPWWTLFSGYFLKLLSQDQAQSPKSVVLSLKYKVWVSSVIFWSNPSISGLKWTFSAIQKPGTWVHNTQKTKTAGVHGFAWGVTYFEYLSWHVANMPTH